MFRCRIGRAFKHYFICVYMYECFYYIFITALGKFFSAGDQARLDMVGPIIERLSYILQKMEQQKLYRFFATSVLIVYEGDTKQPIRKPEDLLDIRLVDFAHAFESDPRDFNEPDFNTIFGISSLIKNLEQLRSTSKCRDTPTHSDLL